MKKIYFLTCLLTIGFSMAYGQFSTATIPEQAYPIPADSCFRSDNINCYGFSDVFFPADGTQDDLSVFCWTKYIGMGNSDCFIGYRRIKAGTNLILDENYFSIPNSKGMDVAILKMDNDFYVIAGYHKTGVGHKLDVYKWNAGNLTLSSSYSLSNTVVYSPVKVDAHDLYGFAVTWADHGKVHVRVGRTDAGSFISCDAVLDQSDDYQYPDIAIGHANSISGSGLSLHFVYTSLNNTQVVESMLEFDDVHLNCMPLMIPHIEEHMNGNFGIPRIDCPDHSDKDDWSFVVSDNNKVVSSVMAHNFSPVPSHYVLNDGSMGNLNITTVSNNGPVLAYDNMGKHIYYGWVSTYVYPSATVGYIGLKMKIDGNLVNSNYWKMLQSITYSFGTGTIALSGQNDHSNDLYSVFSLSNFFGGYQIGHKNIPWSDTSFRPNPTDVLNVKNAGFEISPNPFTQDIQITNLLDRGNEAYIARVSDITGRVLLEYKDNLMEVNKQLNSLGNKLSPGMYILNVSYNQTNKSFKIIKQ